MTTSGTPALCTIALAAEGVAEPCIEDHCAYWQRGCVLARVDSELLLHPEVAGLLLGLRRELELAGDESHRQEHAAAAGRFHERLAAGRE